MSKRLDLRFVPNETLHNDVLLCLGGREWQCDSYWLANDNKVLPERLDEEKVRIVLRQLLEQWHEAVAGVKVGAAVYLPFDFSDQCMRFVRCRRHADGFDVVVGWSNRGGHSVCPSDLGELIWNEPGFDTEGADVAMTREELLACIDASIKGA